MRQKEQKVKIIKKLSKNYQKLPQFSKIAHKCEISHDVKKNDRILTFCDNV